jgi:hypothetical protein
MPSTYPAIPPLAVADAVARKNPCSISSGHLWKRLAIIDCDHRWACSNCKIGVEQSDLDLCQGVTNFVLRQC